MNIFIRYGKAAAILSATLAACVLWFIAHALNVDLVVDMRNGQPPTPVGLAQVAGFTLSLSLLAWGVLAALEKYARHGRTIWRVLALTTLAVSFLPILGVEASVGTKIALSLMHGAVAAVLVPWLPLKRQDPA
ncbi:DUF6069 family protein [Nonomuraea sp. bgisy101]|uniref:DUF6069 family protein n=1 Tax=Nonomuraea sp. bgisy101 TaxID=3413784 RepID=UPI003D70B249